MRPYLADDRGMWRWTSKGIIKRHRCNCHWDLGCRRKSLNNHYVWQLDESWSPELASKEQLFSSKCVESQHLYIRWELSFSITWSSREKCEALMTWDNLYTWQTSNYQHMSIIPKLVLAFQDRLYWLYRNAVIWCLCQVLPPRHRLCSLGCLIIVTFRTELHVDWGSISIDVAGMSDLGHQ
jgi:hypothetical protein